MGFVVLAWCVRGIENEDGERHVAWGENVTLGGLDGNYSFVGEEEGITVVRDVALNGCGYVTFDRVVISGDMNVSSGVKQPHCLLSVSGVRLGNGSYVRLIWSGNDVVRLAVDDGQAPKWLTVDFPGENVTGDPVAVVGGFVDGGDCLSWRSVSQVLGRSDRALDYSFSCDVVPDGVSLRMTGKGRADNTGAAVAALFAGLAVASAISAFVVWRCTAPPPEQEGSRPK